MFAFTLRLLGLRGLVRKGELAVSRLGFGVEATPRTPGDTHPVCPSTAGKRLPDPTQAMPEVGYPTKSIRSGAGRSRRLAGSPLRRDVASIVASLWRRSKGGLARAAAAKASGRCPGLVAFAGGVNPVLATLPITRTGPRVGSR